MSFTIKLTDAATNQIKKIISKNPQSVFRIAIEKTGCSGYRYVSAVIDKALPTDIKIEMAGVTVYVDHASTKFLNGSELDCVDKGLGMWQWLFNNPNAASNCGCGESFNAKEIQA